MALKLKTVSKALLNLVVDREERHHLKKTSMTSCMQVRISKLHQTPMDENVRWSSIPSCLLLIVSFSFNKLNLIKWELYLIDQHNHWS